jgi:transcription termination factor Rho
MEKGQSSQQIVLQQLHAHVQKNKKDTETIQMLSNAKPEEKADYFRRTANIIIIPCCLGFG